MRRNLIKTLEIYIAKDIKKKTNKLSHQLMPYIHIYGKYIINTICNTCYKNYSILKIRTFTEQELLRPEIFSSQMNPTRIF